MFFRWERNSTEGMCNIENSFSYSFSPKSGKKRKLPQITIKYEIMKPYSKHLDEKVSALMRSGHTKKSACERLEFKHTFFHLFVSYWFCCSLFFIYCYYLLISRQRRWRPLSPEPSLFKSPMRKPILLRFSMANWYWQSLPAEQSSHHQLSPRENHR